MLITTELIMSWDPCDDYTEEQISELIGEGKTPLEIAHNKIIPVEHTCWVLLHPEIISENELHELACKFAEDALIREREAGRKPDQRNWAAIEAKRKWLRGEITDQELDAARDATVAVVAARAAARAARYAWYAAYHAYHAAIASLASLAAYHAAWYAAWYAAYHASLAASLATRAAVWDKSLSHIISVIKKQHGNS